MITTSKTSAETTRRGAAAAQAGNVSATELAAVVLARETGLPLVDAREMIEQEGRMGIIRKALEHCGGRVWRCIKCGRYIDADCPCCEPPACGCKS